MCSPTIVARAMEGISRREAFRQGGAALAAGALLSAGWRGAEARTSPGRTISLANAVDLTHTLSGRFPVIPIPGLTFPFKQTVIATLEQNGVFANRWEMIDHNGTHIDAPSHFVPDRPNLEALPLAS